MEEKLQRLKKIISDLESVIVAFSGGVDSTFLLKVAYDVLGENSIALTAVSPSYPAFELQEARELAKNIGVRAPLLEAGLTKEEIRGLSRRMGLSTWDKPQTACLSSRIPYGIRVTEDKLRTIALSELVLRQLGLRQFRVRYHEKIARIEIDESEFEKLLSRNLREIISKRLKELGFTYITIDIEGYRSGSMNELLIK